jgi:hypothetical protein
MGSQLTPVDSTVKKSSSLSGTWMRWNVTVRQAICGVYSGRDGGLNCQFVGDRRLKTSQNKCYRASARPSYCKPLGNDGSSCSGHVTDGDTRWKNGFAAHLIQSQIGRGLMLPVFNGASEPNDHGQMSDVSNCTTFRSQNEKRVITSLPPPPKIVLTFRAIG